MEIKVLGPGCPRCKATEDNVREAVDEAGVYANIEKVTDVMAIAKHGVFTTPAVVLGAHGSSGFSWQGAASPWPWLGPRRPISFPPSSSNIFLLP